VKRARAAAGMTLVELMVGLAVGLFVSLIAISVFVSTRTLNVVNSAGARMGENARLAMEALQDDLRSAAFQGCQDQATEAAQVTMRLKTPDATTSGFLAGNEGGVMGHRGMGTGSGTSFTPALNPALLALTNRPSDDSDVVSARVPVESQGWNLTASMATTTAAPTIGTAGAAGSTIQTGDIVLISDCRFADIFQVTGIPVGTGELQHIAGGASVPGNADAALSRSYRDEAVVYRLQTHHYYVAPSVLRPGTRSLWRLVVPCTDCGANPQELASGVERLSVAWGIDTDAVVDRSINRYVGADTVPVWPNVLSARVQMLVSTSQNGVAQNAAASVAFAGGSVTTGDRRLRTALTEVVALRNRAP